MKLTPVLENGLETLEKHKVLYQRKDLGVPFYYVSKELLETKKIDWKTVYENSINAQTVSKLVLMGYAELDENKKVVKHIDKVESAIKFLEANGYKVSRKEL